MGSAADNIFPLILDSLSQRPLLEETETNLLRDVQLKIRNEGLKIKNLKKEFDQALEIGQQIGILRLIDANVRLPFYLGMRNKNNQESIRSKSASRNTDKETVFRHQRRSSHRRRRTRSRSGKRARSQKRKRSSQK